jgi:hypothetical protein
VELTERARVVTAVMHEREDGLGVDGHLHVRALDSVAGEEIVVVCDDAVVNTDDGSMPNRVVVDVDVRMALREVANVEDDLRCLSWHCNLV